MFNAFQMHDRRNEIVNAVASWQHCFFGSGYPVPNLGRRPLILTEAFSWSFSVPLFSQDIAFKPDTLKV
jgi:hypothetical protein